MIRAILLAGYGANNLLGLLPSDERTDDEQSRVSNETQLRPNLILVLRSELICSKCCCPRRNLVSQLTTLEKYAELSKISFILHESCEFVSLSTFPRYPYSVANLPLHSCISTLLQYALSFHNLRPFNRGLPGLPPSTKHLRRWPRQLLSHLAKKSPPLTKAVSGFLLMTDIIALYILKGLLSSPFSPLPFNNRLGNWKGKNS